MPIRYRIFACLGVAASLAACCSPASAQFLAASLLTDATDADLVNPWGISFSGGSPFWVSDNGTGLSTLYSVNPVSNHVTKAGLRVTIPGDGTPTGNISNSTSAFNSDRFIFVSEDGTISGWRGALGTSAETLQAGSTANVYKGVAIASIGANTYLYATNFRAGTVDVTKSSGAPNLTGSFIDPGIPAGFAPFNIENIGGKLYVTYAKQDPALHDDVPGAGNGFVDAFDLNGNFLARVGTQGTLNSPWGMALAPSSYGQLAGDLLVGNFGDGTINIFNPNTDTFLGQILDGITSNPLSIDGLWSLTAGSGSGAGSAGDIYFTAGPNGETGGVFGTLVNISTPEPGSVALLLALTAGAGLSLRRRRHRGSAGC